MVREPDATMEPAPQDIQLMSKHRVLGFKPQLRLEWRGQDGQNETEQPDHSASLGDSITSSTRIRFSVHTGGNRYVVPNATASHLDSTKKLAFRGCPLLAGRRSRRAKEAIFQGLLGLNIGELKMLREQGGI